jgi:predicted dehydrogenase
MSGPGEQLGAAIIGAGFIGGVHARSARLAGARLVAVAASTPERSAQAATRLGAERGVQAEEVIGAPGIDVVHICAPNDLHAPLAEAALAAGQHVVCEKPLATDLGGAERLAGLAAAAQLVAAVPFVYRYYPTVREARERVRGGAAGPVRLVHGSYLQDWLLRPGDTNWRVDPAAGGASRTFADIGSHWCDLAQFVTGHRIARLSARTLTAVPERPAGGGAAFSGSVADAGPMVAVTTEDAATVQFETDGGAMGVCVVSQISPGRKNRLWIEVDGAEGSVAFDQEEPETLWCGAREGVSIVPRDAEAMSAEAARYVTLPPGHPQGYADCFDAFVAEAYAEIRGGAPEEGLPRFVDGLRAARVTDAVLASAAGAGWVDVADGEPLATTGGEA